MIQSLSSKNHPLCQKMFPSEVFRTQVRWKFSLVPGSRTKTRLIERILTRSVRVSTIYLLSLVVTLSSLSAEIFQTSPWQRKLRCHGMPNTIKTSSESHLLPQPGSWTGSTIAVSQQQTKAVFSGITFSYAQCQMIFRKYFLNFSLFQGTILSILPILGQYIL